MTVPNAKKAPTLQSRNAGALMCGVVIIRRNPRHAPAQRLCLPAPPRQAS